MNINTIWLIIFGAFISIIFVIPVISDEVEDTRILIELPPDVQTKMLMNMRDHIRALDDIIHAVEAEDYEKAERISESRLGWSSLVRQGAHRVPELNFGLCERCCR